MEFLEIPLYDDDFLKMLVRLAINLVVIFVIVNFCYRSKNSDRSFVFTYLLMNVMVFFVCFTLKKLDLGLGMALGLFAIFAIIRFRTDSISVKEMTYLFLVIGLAVINALSNKKTSYIELAFTNLAVVSLAFLLEQFQPSGSQPKQNMVYDNLALLRPENRMELIADIEKRTGLKANSIKISKIDLVKGSAAITVYFDPRPGE